MSAENVNIVKAFLDASMRRDWTRVAELTDPDVELHGTVSGVGEGRVYRGLAEVIREYEEVDGEAWEERHIEPEKFLDANDHVVVLLHEYGVAEAAESSWRTTRRLSSQCATDLWCAYRDSWIAQQPSKPPGCRSKAID